MKFAYLALFTLTLSSCAVVKRIQHTTFGFNYSKVQPGTELNVALLERDDEKSVIETLEGNLYLYSDGYFLVKNGKVERSSQYDLFLGKDDLLSNNIEAGQSLLEVVTSLGRPVAIEEEGGKLLIRYKRGAILAQDSKIVAAFDNMYSDLVFNIDVNSYTDHTVTKNDTFMIIPGSEKINPQDFQFKEVKSFISSALKDAGFRTTEDPKNAKYIVLANYGISDPQEDIKIVSTPVFVPRYLPGASYTVIGANQNSAFVANTYTDGTWTTQYAGQKTETIKTVTFNRWLNLEAVDFEHLKKTKEMKPVWKILANSTGSSGDLRYVLPALSYGAEHFLDKDSKRALRVSFNSEEMNQYLFWVKMNDFTGRSVAGKKK